MWLSRIRFIAIKHEVSVRKEALFCVEVVSPGSICMYSIFNFRQLQEQQRQKELERERMERERLERERLERERMERERLEQEQLERQRQEREHLERLERERLERLERERQDRERLEQLEQVEWERERRVSNAGKEPADLCLLPRSWARLCAIGNYHVSHVPCVGVGSAAWSWDKYSAVIASVFLLLPRNQKKALGNFYSVILILLAALKFSYKV